MIDKIEKNSNRTRSDKFMISFFILAVNRTEIGMLFYLECSKLSFERRLTKTEILSHGCGTLKDAELHIEAINSKHTHTHTHKMSYSKYDGGAGSFNSLQSIQIKVTLQVA